MLKISIPKLMILALLAFVACTPENDILPKPSISHVSFKIGFDNLDQKGTQNKALKDIPDCSEASPSYVEVVITGPVNIGSDETPRQIGIVGDGTSIQTVGLDLEEGNYQLRQFRVYDSSDVPIWAAPSDNESSAFVSHPLPKSFEVSPTEQTNVDIDVVCFDNRKLIDPDALTAEQFVAQLGKGFDVTWSEFSRYMDLYSEQVVMDFKEAGFTNVRIRMNEQNPDATFIDNLKTQVDHCLAHGIYPILAYQGHYLEDTATTDEEAGGHLAIWWGNMAEVFKDYPPELTFNIMVEISGRYKTDYNAMNSFYVDVYDAIRETNPSRIIIFPPVNISNPEYLEFLEIPGENDPYTMAEWHFYAAGPNRTIGNKKYWLDGSTSEERENITGPIQTAVQWMNDTGHVTWVGAWMAGNYNKGNEFSIPEQVHFASFMTRELAKENIPWSINAGNKYYDYENNQWFAETSDAAGIPVRDVILNPDEIALYTGTVYMGNSYRLTEGSYTKADLEALGIVPYEINSIMVPFDFNVKAYSGDNFTGTETEYSLTSPVLSTDIVSLVIVNKRSF